MSIYEPGYRVPLADSLGAGDAFSAGFLHTIMRDRPLGEACRFGNILGAIVSTQKGATQPITSENIKSFEERFYERIIDPDLDQYIQ